MINNFCNGEHHNQKLYLITRRDLPAGAQAVQAAHALTKFIEEHPEGYHQWYRHSQYIGFLSVHDLASLERLCSRLDGLGIAYSRFTEPDLDGVLTAIAVEPTPEATRYLSDVPLAMKEYKTPYAMTG